MIITPSFSALSIVFSDQTCSSCSCAVDGGFVKLLLDCFVETGSSKWILSSTCTFAAVVLWFLDTAVFNVWHSLSLSLGFRPLFLLAVDVIPWFAYFVITMETAALDTPNKVTILVTYIPAEHTPIICPLWKFDKSPVLQYFHMNCVKAQSVMHWHWHYTV